MSKAKKSGRALAIQVLGEILQEKAYGNITLRKALKGSSSPMENAFITEIVTLTLRNLILIDYIINGFTKTPISGINPFIRDLLRISVCQLRFLAKTPDHAAVNEAVELAKNNGFRNLAGFVNGVLRSIARNPNKPILPLESLMNPESLALIYSYPVWMVREIIKWLGEERALSFFRQSHTPPSMIVHVNTTKTTPEVLTEQFEADGITVREVAPVDGMESVFPFLSISRFGDISSLASFKKGLFFVMDPGGAMAVEALDPKPNQVVYDMAAAPGGKSFAIACQMENKGLLKAFDIHPHRVELIRSSKRRLELGIIEPIVHDVLVPKPTLEKTADAVLLDAPCSGLGTLRKHPEMKYTRSYEDIVSLAVKQKVMLSASGKYVKPGGKLIYCTCTISPMENEEVVEDFLTKHQEFSLMSNRLTHPGDTNDGFFTATFIRCD